MSSRTWYLTTTIPHRIELAPDQLLDEAFGRAPLSSLIALVKNRTRDANEFAVTILAASIAIGPLILIGSLPPGAQSTLALTFRPRGASVLLMDSFRTLGDYPIQTEFRARFDSKGRVRRYRGTPTSGVAPPDAAFSGFQAIATRSSTP